MKCLRRVSLVAPLPSPPEKKPSLAAQQTMPPEPQPPAVVIPMQSGATAIGSRAIFEQLARRDDVPGALGVLEVKFLMTGVDTAQPVVYFLNTKNIQYHFLFAVDVLGIQLTNQQFNQQTYFTDNRKFLAGTILAHDSFTWPDGGQGVYVFEFWPTDPVKVHFVNMAYQTLQNAMPFAASQLAYHPAGETHQELYQAEQEQFEQLGIRSVSTEQLFGSTAYSPLNPGESYGRLRLIDAADPQPPTVRDIVIFKQLPNDLTHVAGVLTEVPQTPLSHINLKAKQNNTPNAYVKNASSDPRIAPLLGKNVYLRVASDDIEIREATQAELDSYMDNIRPQEPQIPVRDLSKTAIVDLDQIGHADTQAYGAKAANVAELRKILTAPNMVPDGYAVPFSFYHRFMSENGLYDTAEEMISDAAFQQNADLREEKLKQFRRQMKDAPLADDLAQSLAAMQAAFPQEHPLRCRSSTNNEDLEGFNGAGLYDSYTHRQNEGHIAKSIKQVWASLWNYRAFEEREFYRIDHFAAAMAVLVHPNFDDELANGVALTKNIFDPNWEGYYINVQLGEYLVTNPDPGAVPDELLVMRTVVSDTPLAYGNEIIYIRRSSLITPPGHVLSNEQIEWLTVQLRKIQNHFKEVYGRQEDDAFAMDVEFKISNNPEKHLVIKQARPWVD